MEENMRRLWKYMMGRMTLKQVEDMVSRGNAEKVAKIMRKLENEERKENNRLQDEKEESEEESREEEGKEEEEE